MNNIDAQNMFNTGFNHIRRRITQLLNHSLVPVFATPTSKRANPRFTGTAVVVQSEGLRFLATAKHVLDDGNGGVSNFIIRDSENRLQALDACIPIEFIDLDLILFDVSNSRICAKFNAIAIDVNTLVEPNPGEVLYLEGYPASKNKASIQNGMRPIGFPVKAHGRTAVDESHSKIATVNGTRGYFSLDRGNYVDENNADVQCIPYPQGMSGCPIFFIGPTANVANNSSQVQPIVVGILTEFDESDHLGAYAPLVPALQVAIAETKK